jgi:hypothetical protein
VSIQLLELARRNNVALVGKLPAPTKLFILATTLLLLLLLLLLGRRASSAV